MFSCRAFPKTKQRSLDFQPPLISDKCGAFRNYSGSAGVGGFRDLPLGLVPLLGAENLRNKEEGFPSRFWGKRRLKKDLVCTACLAALVGSH